MASEDSDQTPDTNTEESAPTPDVDESTVSDVDEPAVDEKVPAPPSQPSAPSRRPSPKVLKIAAIVVVVILIIGLVWVLLGTAKVKPKSQTAAGSSKTVANQYVDSQAGFKITLPPGWERNTKPPAGVTVIFEDPTADTGASGPFAPTINVTSGSAQGLSLKDYVNAGAAYEAKTFTDYRGVDSSNETISGLTATLQTFTLLSGANNVTSCQLTVIKNNTAYIVTGISLTSTWTKHANAMKNAILSFQL